MSFKKVFGWGFLGLLFLGVTTPFSIIIGWPFYSIFLLVLGACVFIRLLAFAIDCIM